jgi:MoaA/NifB/PqqE/SkfB family radical SAM enzyme
MNSADLIQIEPTSKCNFHCGFCSGRAMDQSNLTLAKFKEVVNKFPSVSHIELQGEGEPLLHPKLFEMIHYANNKSIKISLITNGSLLARNNNIEKILECKIDSIRISLESPKAEDFLRIRGGDINEVIKGIKMLISARNVRNALSPSLGLAVTLLRSSKEKLRDIASLYLSLGMDGGISVQMLNLMKDYTSIYSPEVFSEVLTQSEKVNFWNSYFRDKELQAIQANKSKHIHFYDELFPPRIGESLKTERLFRSCPWLDKSLYINRNGVVTACCSIKNTKEFALGTIEEDSAEQILNKRDVMKKKIRAGFVPMSCHNCRIAESIASRVNRLLPKKIIINKSKSLIYSELHALSSTSVVTGNFDFSESVLEEILNYSNGSTYISDIIKHVMLSKLVDNITARSAVLSLIDELVRMNLANLVD